MFGFFKNKTTNDDDAIASVVNTHSMIINLGMIVREFNRIGGYTLSENDYSKLVDTIISFRLMAFDDIYMHTHENNENRAKIITYLSLIGFYLVGYRNLNPYRNTLLNIVRPMILDLDTNIEKFNRDHLPVIKNSAKEIKEIRSKMNVTFTSSFL
jgi:hypothetical protein